MRPNGDASGPRSTQIKARYQKRYERNQPLRDAIEMARLAEQLGRWFEARVFLAVATVVDPDRVSFAMISSGSSSIFALSQQTIARSLRCSPTSLATNRAPSLFAELGSEHDVARHFRPRTESRLVCKICLECAYQLCAARDNSLHGTVVTVSEGALSCSKPHLRRFPRCFVLIGPTSASAQHKPEVIEHGKRATALVEVNTAQGQATRFCILHRQGRAVHHQCSRRP